MLPSSPDLAAWLTRTLGLRAFSAEEGEGSCALALRLAEELGIDPIAATEIESTLDAARSGEPSYVDLEVQGAPRGRLAAYLDSAGHLTILFSPPRVDDPAFARRAANAERAAGVTHELANALTAIAGWARLAGGAALPERSRRAIEVVERSAREALESARGLLDAMRDAGRTSIMPSAPERASASRIAREVVDALQPRLADAGLDWRLELDDDGEAETSLGAADLRLVISNLVRNAIEASPAGSSLLIEVRAGAGWVRCEVADQGPGMSPATLARVFDRYFTTKSTGTGLGLALVQETLNARGGRLEVDTELGRGSRFRAFFPRARGEIRNVGRAMSGVVPRFEGGLEGARLLVVDDDEAILSMIHTALELTGADVTTATSAGEAMGLSGHFDIAIVDLALGTDGSGDELIDALRARSAIDAAVLLTGAPEVRPEQARSADALLRKPFEITDLTRLLAQLHRKAPTEAEG